MSSRPCRRPANCHRDLGTFIRFHRHSKAIIHEYLRAQAYTFNLVQRGCHICLHDLLCARVVAYIRKCIFRYICGYRSALFWFMYVLLRLSCSLDIIHFGLALGLDFLQKKPISCERDVFFRKKPEDTLSVHKKRRKPKRL